MWGMALEDTTTDWESKLPPFHSVLVSTQKTFLLHAVRIIMGVVELTTSLIISFMIHCLEDYCM